MRSRLGRIGLGQMWSARYVNLANTSCPPTRSVAGEAFFYDRFTNEAIVSCHSAEFAAIR